LPYTVAAHLVFGAKVHIAVSDGVRFHSLSELVRNQFPRIAHPKGDMKKEKRGRKTCINYALIRKICGLLYAGCDIKTACSISQISERAFHSWKERGQKNEQPYAEFFDAASRARNLHKARLLKIVLDAARKDAKFACWLLERGWPNQFARTEPRVTGITDVEGKPFTLPQQQPQHIEQYIVRIGYKDADERDKTERLLDDIVERQSEIVR
jgi:hypothetical protein